VLSARYAQRRNERKRALDPMKDEVWDVEVDGYWSQTSHVDQYPLKLYDEPPGTPGAANLAFSSAPGAAVLATPQQAVIPRHWRDTFGVRVGGDYNVLPSLLALRAGFSYESRAVPVEYMNIDAYPVARLGLHVGATLALDNWKLTAAYEHLFYQSIQVGVGVGKVNEVVSQNPEAAQAVNEGYYQAAQDIFSVQANVAL
jgi:long-chain fatty acid transport protein